MDTINKLLKKPAPKKRTRAEIMAASAAAEGTPGEEDAEYEMAPADPLYVRYVNSAAGSRIGVPTEWLEGPVGEQLREGWKGPARRKLVEEVS